MSPPATSLWHGDHRSDGGIQSPGQGLQPNRLDNLIGKTLLINKDAGDFFSQIWKPRQPPRAPIASPSLWAAGCYHDIESFAANSNLDPKPSQLQGSEVNLDQVLPTQQPIGLWCTPLNSLPAITPSISAALITTTGAIRSKNFNAGRYLPTCADVSIASSPSSVTNVGDFEHHHLEHPMQPLRQRLIESLQQIKTSDEVEIIPQTMPPSPGTSGTAVSQPVDTDFIQFCEVRDARLPGCLPPKLACTHLNASFSVPQGHPSLWRTCIWPTLLWTKASDPRR